MSTSTHTTEPPGGGGPCTIRLHLGRDSYQGDTSHELCFGVPKFRLIHIPYGNEEACEFDHPTGRTGCTLPLPDWFIYRLFGRLLRPGEVQPIDLTVWSVSADYTPPITDPGADLIAACLALLNAPRQEHLAARLNDAETAAVDHMRRAMTALVQEVAT